MEVNINHPFGDCAIYSETAAPGWTSLQQFASTTADHFTRRFPTQSHHAWLKSLFSTASFMHANIPSIRH